MPVTTTVDAPNPQREDLSDIIYNIAPTETPILTTCGVTNATATMHEWQQDTLEAPAANAQIEGYVPATFAGSDTTRLNNHTQISTKEVKITGTNETVDKAGMDSQFAYQKAKRSRELKTDVDLQISGAAIALGPKAAGLTRRSASLETWLTNIEFGVGGAAPSPADGSDMPNNGTLEALTQADLDSVIEQCWLDGGRPSIIVAGGKNKAAISKMDGLGNQASASTHRTDRGEGTIFATADVYVSNFGTLTVLPSRHIRKTLGTGGTEGAVAGIDRNIFLIDPEYLKVAYLRSWQEKDLAITGDFMSSLLLVEWTLEVCNTNAHGVVADRNGTYA